MLQHHCLDRLQCRNRVEVELAVAAVVTVGVGVEKDTKLTAATVRYV